MILSFIYSALNPQIFVQHARLFASHLLHRRASPRKTRQALGSRLKSYYCWCISKSQVKVVR